MYTIYKMTNLVNGKIYVGQTCRSVDARLRDHTTKINASMYYPIHKYGKENFKIEPIDYAESKDDALKKESEWIRFLDSTNPEIGYNKSVLYIPSIPHADTVRKIELKNDEVKTTKIQKVEPIRTKAEIAEMKNALYELGGKRDRFLFTFGINTGLRISDIVPIKVEQIKSKAYADIFEQKTGKKAKNPPDCNSA